jgi:hypothetical protein
MLYMAMELSNTSWKRTFGDGAARAPAEGRSSGELTGAAQVA